MTFPSGPISRRSSHRGDRRVGRILLAVHQAQGDWGKALRETIINPDFYVYRKRDLDEIFPWDFIDQGFPKERLKEEYLKAMKEAGDQKFGVMSSEFREEQ